MVMQRTLTVAEFLELPEVKPGREFVRGEVVQKPMTNSDHIRLALRLAAIFDRYCEEHGGVAGPEGTTYFEDPADDRVLLPDLAYWAPDRPTGHYPMTPPTLAIEIRSPSQTMAEQREKCAYYRSHGDVAWLIDPASRTVEVFEGPGAPTVAVLGQPLRSPHLPGLEVPVDQVFAVLDR
ncbi:MAG: Uma2 family endonuclease [Chloroflexi bacterium]|nr:Uma2 family endonuclease [Chloroflexota bacterium]